MQGCFLTHPNIYPSTWTGGLAEWADAVVVVLGFSPLMEGEQGECIGAPDGGDKAQIRIPENQMALLREMKEIGKPIVAVVTGGSPLELEEVHELADAVLMAWYPGEQGGIAVGNILFGEKSPSGKLPVTFPKRLEQLPPYTDYNLEGRTYRYMTEEPMYPFGFGLSYTKFSYSGLQLSRNKVPMGKPVTASVTVKNIGSVKADEVVQLYVTNHQTELPLPLWALKAFKRLTLAPGQSRKIRFIITPEMMQVYMADGERTVLPGEITVTIGGASPHPRNLVLGGSEPATARFTVECRLPPLPEPL